MLRAAWEPPTEDEKACAAELAALWDELHTGAPSVLGCGRAGWAGCGPCANCCGKLIAGLAPMRTCASLAANACTGMRNATQSRCLPAAAT